LHALFITAKALPPATTNDRQVEGQVADLKRRIPALKRLIADCDRMAADLDQEVRNEEDRVKIHDPANSACSTYVKATASRRDNLRCSADELRAHLAKAKKALIELGEAILAVPFNFGCWRSRSLASA
jgi:flagellar protein FliJ